MLELFRPPAETMDTLPVPLAGPGLDDYRLGDPREVAAMLRRMCESDTPLHLHGGVDGSLGTARATLWTADPERGTVGLAVDADDPGLAQVLGAGSVTVVAYLDHVKLQFDAAEPVLVRGPDASVLRAAFPQELYRFQRRNAFRVRPPLRSTPVASLRHTDIAEMQLALRVVDISIGGCALFLPQDVPPMQLGGVMNRVRIDLDDETQFTVDLRLQHVTSLDLGAGGVQIGCEFVRADGLVLRALQRFIDQAQKRSRKLDTEGTTGS